MHAVQALHHSLVAIGQVMDKHLYLNTNFLMIMARNTSTMHTETLKSVRNSIWSRTGLNKGNIIAIARSPNNKE